MIGTTTPQTSTVFHGIQRNTVTNDLDTPTAERHRKVFATLAAQLAMHGHQLARSDSQDGAVHYYVHYWGQVFHLPDLDAVAAFVRQIGGHHV